MAMKDSMTQREYDKFVEDSEGNTAIRTLLSSGDIQIGSVEIKDATDDIRAKVKSDGTDNALVVVQNTVPTTTVTATDLDIRDLTNTTDSVTAHQGGTWNINNVSGTISLPTDAATETTLDKLENEGKLTVWTAYNTSLSLIHISEPTRPY